MSRKVPSPSFNSLTRYHSAPGSFMSNMNVDEEDSISHLHGSSNPCTRADAILTSLFSDDLTAWPQQNGAGGPVHMFHQFPILDEHNNLMPKQLDPNKPTLGMEKSRPGKLPHELASGSKEAGPSQFAALAYTNVICADEFVFDQGPRSRWKLQEDESNETIILAQHQLPNSSKGLIRTSSPQQSSSPAQFFKYFSDTQIPEEVREQRKCPRTSHVPKSLAKNLIEDLSETLDSPRIELNGCGEVDNEKCSTLDNFSSVTGTSPTSKKHFRSITTDSSSADILLDGGLQEQTCISFSKQELPPSNFTPCQSRAKRGHATHPRSIAERVRRTRISERIKKLQDLVPNLDKQINTADMLDEVVDYVKFLQKQVQELSKDCPPKVD